jgi:hypothetical protein
MAWVVERALADGNPAVLQIEVVIVFSPTIILSAIIIR